MNVLRLLKSIHQHQPISKLCHLKYSSHHPARFLEIQDKWRETDGMSKNWELVYKAPMDNAINFTSAYLTLSSSIIATSALYYTTFVFDYEAINDPLIWGDGIIVANNATEFIVYLTSFFLFHIAIKVLLNKYVLRLYQNDDNYVAVFRGHWYNYTFKHKFHLNDFKKLSPTFVVSWGNARYDLGKKHGILLENYFKTPEHLNYLLFKRKNKLID
ncbi:uncharacterized protein LOC119830084 [Zerene cesonia]|uniref:uncharacterized protein LOC119830084 n=1 Tax=Zerene cesonia TaxID=33412 RepID=UPI0018E5A5E5|nr:uncharacterized protein LOC119830084 [Zerene cesonia]